MKGLAARAIYWLTDPIALRRYASPGYVLSRSRWWKFRTWVADNLWRK